MSEVQPNTSFPVISFTRKIVQIVSFIVINFVALELIFNIDLSIFKEYILAYPFIQTPRDPWGMGAGLLEFTLYSLIRGEVPFLLLGIFFLTTLVTARFFCGWICPVGFIQDIVAAVPQKPGRMEIETDKALKKVKFWIVAALLVTAVFFGVIHSTDINRWAAWNTEVGTFFQRPLSSFSLSEFLFYTLPESITTLWEELSVENIFTNGWQVASFIFYVIIIIVSFYYPRFYCRVMCPYGGASAFVSEYSLLKLARNPAKCVGRRDCGICEKVCPMQIRLLDESYEGFTGGGECILCGKCKEACPYDAINLKFGK